MVYTINDIKAKLQDLSNTMATNIGDKGVACTYNDGLEILADKIAQISTGARYNIGLDDYSPVTYDGDVTVTCILTRDDEALEGKEVIIYNLNDETEKYIGVTDENGVITFNITTDVPEKNFKVISMGASALLNVIYHNFWIDAEVGIIANEYGRAHISAILKDWDNPVSEESMQLIKNDSVVGSNVTNNNGEVFFNVTVTETTYYKFKYILPNETFIEKEYGVQFNEIEREHIFTMDDTQYIESIVGGNMQFVECDPEENNGAEFYITGSNSYINLPWDNNLWEFECEAWFHINSGLVLVQNGMTSRDRGEFYTVQGNSTNYYIDIGAYTKWGTRYQVFSGLQTGIARQDDYWFFITIKKQTEDTIEVNLYDINDKENPIITKTLDHTYTGVQKNCCLGFTSWGNTNQNAKIRNARVKYTNFTIPVLEETYAPKLDGTEQLTLLRNHIPEINQIDNEMYIIWDFGGYLTEGFKNTNFWEVTFDVKLLEGSQTGADCFICNKGVTGQRRKQSWNYEANSQPYSESDKSIGEGQFKLSTITSSEWKSVTIRKLNNKYITIQTVGTNINNEIQYWNNSTYDFICVGISSWGSASKIKIKNIHAKTSLEERE